MSPGFNCPRTLSLIEMICVFDAAALASGLGDWLSDAPHGLNRMTLDGPIVMPGCAMMSASLAVWRAWLKPLLAPLAQNSHVPDVFCATVFGLAPAVALYL